MMGGYQLEIHWEVQTRMVSSKQDKKLLQMKTQTLIQMLQSGSLRRSRGQNPKEEQLDLWKSLPKHAANTIVRS